MEKKRLAVILVIGALLIGNVYFILKTSEYSKDLAIAQNEISTFHKNERVIDFTRMFVIDVLNSGNEVDFDTRLKLENAVRGIKDDEILTQWNKFTKSADEKQAQVEVKHLLDLLVRKI